MGAILIFDGTELAPVLSGTHLPTSEGWKAELAWQREEEVGKSVVWPPRGIERGSLAWWHNN